MGYLIPSLFLFNIMKYKDIYKKDNNLVIVHENIDKEVVGTVNIFASKKSFINNDPDHIILQVTFSGEESLVYLPEDVVDSKLFLLSIDINDESIGCIYADKSFIYLKVLNDIEDILKCCRCEGMIPHLYKVSPLIYLASQMAKEGDLLMSYELFKQLLNVAGENINEPESNDGDDCCSLPAKNGRLYEKL